MKSIKEKQLLVNFARSMGQDVDPTILEEVKQINSIKNSIKKSVQENALADLFNAIPKQQPVLIEEDTYPLPPSLDDLLQLFEEKETTNELVQEKTEIKRASEINTSSEQSDIGKITEGDTGESETSSTGQESGAQTLAELTAKLISEAPKNSYQQPDPLVVPNDMDAIRGKLKFLEQWVSKISMTGPGGGAGSVAKLDHETKLVNTNSYVLTTKDFYVGVNYAGPVTITLPTIVNNGRMYIIKDESGHCSTNPITVLGNVDNDSGGFILAQDNGGIQLIYRNGWRIV